MALWTFVTNRDDDDDDDGQTKVDWPSSQVDYANDDNYDENGNYDDIGNDWYFLQIACTMPLLIGEQTPSSNLEI